MENLDYFICQYCKIGVRPGDFHAQEIVKKNLKDKLTIIVTCKVVREYQITLKEEN